MHLDVVDPGSVMVYDAPATSGGVLRDTSWTIPLVAIASINVVSISLFEAFILAKTLVGDAGGRHFGGGGGTSVSRRHFFLGQILLLGLFGSSLIGLIFVAPTSPFVCGLTRQVGVALVLVNVLAPLLVKCVFLISLHGGVYLPSAYLALLLLFAIAVQLALGVQWLFLRPPDVDNLAAQHGLEQRGAFDDGRAAHNDATVTFSMVAPPRPACNASFGEVLFGLTYVFVMLVAVLTVSIRYRRIRDNYRESVYIAVASCCVLVIWTIGVLVALVNGGADAEDSCLAFALEATAAVVFLVMFAPKGRQLAAMGREGLYVEDQRVEGDMSSSCLPPPAVAPPTTMRYPGFYHFNPAAQAPPMHHRRPPTAFVPSSEAIYRIPASAAPDHIKCHKMSPATYGAHCRRHVGGPIYKTAGVNYGGHGQTLPNSSMLY